VNFDVRRKKNTVDDRMARRRRIMFGVFLFKDYRDDGFSHLENSDQDDQRSEDAPFRHQR
jgi:hypothetical protein